MSTEFLEYIPTPTEKYSGVAKIRVTLANGNRMILRYKMIMRKDGAGSFPAVAAYRVPDDTGVPAFAQAFELDSSDDKKAMDNFLREHIKRWNTRPTQPQPSQPAYTQQPQYYQNQAPPPPQPNPNYQPQPQQMVTPQWAQPVTPIPPQQDFWANQPQPYQNPKGY